MPDLPTLLIVEDHAAMQKFLRMALGNHYRLQFASDGSRAIAALAARLPDAVLLDWLLPGRLSGLDVLRLIRRTSGWEHLPVAILTNLDDGPSILAAFQHGADEFFTKPIHPERLQGWLRNVLTPGLSEAA